MVACGTMLETTMCIIAPDGMVDGLKGVPFTVGLSEKKFTNLSRSRCFSSVGRA